MLGSHSLSKYSARFDGLKPGTSYDIQVATELAGKTVVQTRHTFKTLQAETETASTTTDTQARGCVYILPVKPFLPNEILRKFLHIRSKNYPKYTRKRQNIPQ